MKSDIRRIARLSLLLALATMIHTLESTIPISFLWFRFGFANIIGLAALYLFGFRDALLITIGRIFLGSLATGLFASPAFLLSLSGGTSAIIAMGLAHKLSKEALSEIGISLIGAVTHNSVQLLVAYALLVRNESVLLLLPIMLAAALGTGLLNGIAARFFVSGFGKALQPAMKSA